MQSLLKSGESQTIEFKRSFGAETLETIGAFANAEGGVVFIGVEDNGDVAGVAIGKGTLEDWSNQIEHATDPRLQPSMQVLNEAGKQLVKIKVEASSGIPVSVKGRFLRRVGRTNQRMSHEEIMQRLYASTGNTWDSGLEPEAKFEDLDLTAIERFLAQLRRVGRRPIPEDTTAVDALEKLKLTCGGAPTRAALLLFAKDPLRYLPVAYVKLGRFRSPTLIVDDRRIEGGLLAQIEECMSWFRERFTTEFVISGKPQRDVIWEYPLDAVREATINAICHRDYRVNTNIQVRLYDDRLEISNPGGLPQSLRPEDLFSDHDSIPRNRLLAECLFFCGAIETWGSGTLRMVAELKKAGLAPPEFDTEKPNRFKVIFRQGGDYNQRLSRLGLNQRQIRALKHAQRFGAINSGRYSDLFETSERTAARELRALVDKGLLTRQGTTGKGTYYSCGSPSMWRVSEVEN